MLERPQRGITWLPLHALAIIISPSCVSPPIAVDVVLLASLSRVRRHLLLALHSAPSEAAPQGRVSGQSSAQRTPPYYRTSVNRLVLTSPIPLPLSLCVQHRVCENCHRNLRSQAAGTAISPLALSPLAAAASAAPFPPQLLYHSQSLCARCSFVDRSGFTLHPSVVFACLPDELPDLTPATVRSLPASLPSYATPAAVQSTDVGAASSAAVYLGVCCNEHPTEPFVLLSSSFSFFVRTMTFDHPPPAAASASLSSSSSSSSSSRASTVSHSALSAIVSRDIEDLRPAASTSSLPLLVELSVWRDGGGGGWMSDAELDCELLRFHSLFPPSHSFVIKVNGGLLERKSDVLTLNQKLHHILTLAAPAPPSVPSAAAGWRERVSACPLVVDLTFDRLIDLALLDDSALLKANVLPCVRYFLSSTPDDDDGRAEQSVEAGQPGGVASLFISQMSGLLNALHTITDMSLLLLLTIDEPAPPTAELQAILHFVQSHHSIIRMMVVTRERSPSVILKQLLSPPSSTASSPTTSVASSASPPTSSHSTDPFSLLAALESASQGRIRPTDFIPLRAFALLSPVLSMFGFRQFGLTASPFCLMATVLVNTPTLRSIPLSHLVDLHRLYHSLLPLAQSLNSSNAASNSPNASSRPSLSLSDLKRVQRVLKSCMIARLDVPDLMSYVTGRHEETTAKLRAVLRSMQVVVLHNKMDVASVDMQRRCECLVMQPSPLQQDGYVAQCTGCI